MMEAVIATAGFVVKLYKIHSDIFTNIILQKLAGGGYTVTGKCAAGMIFCGKEEQETLSIRN